MDVYFTDSAVTCHGIRYYSLKGSLWNRLLIQRQKPGIGEIRHPGIGEAAFYIIQ